MTFEQIQSGRETYVNQNGVVFTPYRGLGKIMVSYSIDSDTAVRLVKRAHALTALYRNPGKVDYLAVLKLAQATTSR